MIAARFIGWIDPVKVVIPPGKSVVVLRRIYPVLHTQNGHPNQFHYRPAFAGRQANDYRLTTNDFPLLLHSRYHFRRVFLSNTHYMKNPTIKCTGIGIDHHRWCIHKCFLFPDFEAKE
jgi:hypothetical protein